MKQSRIRLFQCVAVVLLALSFHAISAQPVNEQQDLFREIDDYVSEMTRLKRFSGSVLVAKQGQVILNKGYGKANYELDVPNRPETKFRLGSISKQFAAAAIMMLEVQGKLKAEDKVCKYINDCPDAWHDITILQVIHHTSGIPSFTGFSDYLKQRSEYYSIEDLVGWFRDRPLDFTPGEKWSYSNSGYALLGYLVKIVSGMHFEDYLQQNILEPLGMHNTGYDHNEDILPNRAAGYLKKKGQICNAGFIDMSVPHAAGALYSTTGDLYKWDQALYTNKLFSEQVRKRLFAPGGDHGYAYGWMIADENGHLKISHGGGIDGFQTHLVRYVNDKVTIVALNNIQNGQPSNVTRDIAAILFGDDYEFPTAKTVMQVNPETFDRFEGKYKRENVVYHFFRNDNELLAEMKFNGTVRGELLLMPEDTSRFFDVDNESMVFDFVESSNGEAEKLIIDLGGNKQEFEKMFD